MNISIAGDSIAAGHYASNPYATFRTLMYAALQARGAVNVQDPTTTALTATLSPALTVPAGMDLVVLELGTDDIPRTDVTTFGSAYSALVKNTRASSPNAALVCAGTWSANGSAFDAVIQRACTSANGTYVSLASRYADPANRDPAGVSTYFGVTDGLAPNDAGHRAIAAALLKPLGVALT